MHTQEIQNLINTALHAPATGSIVIQGALFLDIISRLENAEQQNAELLDAVRKSQSAAEKIKALLMMDGSLSAGKIRGHLATIQVECGLANEAIAKAGDKT